jgi:UDP-N-acetyl-2-amino-2-deoxyglucuronate dehydrogenase
MTEMAQKIRWGVIGCGGIAARRTIPEFKTMVSNAEIVSVMDISGERAEEVAAEFGVPHHCASEADLLAQDIDAVYIATPQNVHCRQSVQAAEAGKHILCEKPIAITREEVDQIERACRDAKVKFMLGFCMRNNVYNRKARELVQGGALGQMVMGRAQLTCWYPPIPGAWRQDASVSHGGALLDMGTHCLDILEWIFGASIVEVTGFQDLITHAYPTRIEDASTIALRFSNGAHGIVDNYFNLPDAAAQNALELHGTKGSIVAQGTIGQDPTGKMFSILQDEETGYDANQVRDAGPERQSYEMEGIGLYGQMITQFSDCILEDKEPPVTLADGRHSVAVVDAIYKAIGEKRVVRVEE